MKPLQHLKDTLLATHGCSSTHIESAKVVETFEGETVWDGTVEVFDLIDHPTAQRAYAWAYETDAGNIRYLAVLHEPPVDSPETAVRAAIAAGNG